MFGALNANTFLESLSSHVNTFSTVNESSSGRNSSFLARILPSGCLSPHHRTTIPSLIWSGDCRSRGFTSASGLSSSAFAGAAFFAFLACWAVSCFCALVGNTLMAVVSSTIRLCPSACSSPLHTVPFLASFGCTSSKASPFGLSRSSYSTLIPVAFRALVAGSTCPVISSSVPIRISSSLKTGGGAGVLAAAGLAFLASATSALSTSLSSAVPISSAISDDPRIFWSSIWNSVGLLIVVT